MNLTFLPCLDSPGMAETCHRELDISRFKASELGQSAVEAAERGYYVTETGKKVDWSAFWSPERKFLKPFCDHFFQLNAKDNPPGKT